MSIPFDPYYTWLGIPPEEQPPTCYRLLGVRLFEENLDVIENAANARANYLGGLQSGEHPAEARRLLEEVRAARIELLDSGRKAQYDQQIRQCFPAGPAAPQSRASLEAPPVCFPKKAPAAAQPSAFPSEPIPARIYLLRAFAVGAAAAGALLLLALLGWLRQGNLARERAAIVLLWPESQREGAEMRLDQQLRPVPPTGAVEIACEPGRHRISVMRPGFAPYEQVVTLLPDQTESVRPTWIAETKQVEGRKKPPESLQPPTAPPEQPPTERPVGESAAITPKPPQAAAPALPGPKPRPVEPPPMVESSAPAAETPPQTRPEPGMISSSPSQPQRLPQPSVDIQNRIAEDLKETLRTGATSSAEENLQRARQWIELADQAKERPNERYVLLRRATELAARAGDLDLAVAAVETLATEFEVDAIELKADAISTLAAQATEEKAIGAVVKQVDRFIDEAVAGSRLEIASRVADEAYQACMRSQGKPFRKPMYDRRAEVQRLQPVWQQFQEQSARLAEKPDDPEANLAVGRWYCLVQGDWARGLPHLAKGSDAELSNLARKELAGPPVSPEETIAMGDAWWDAAQSRSDEDKSGLMRHAGTWYEQARLKVASSLQQTKLTKRLEEIAKLGRAPAVEKPPAAEFPQGRWVDVMSRVAPGLDSVAGNWQQVQGALTVTPAKASRLMLPVQVKGSYDLQVEFVRLEGDDSVAILFPVGSESGAFHLGMTGQAAGLARIDGRLANSNPTTRRRVPLVNNQRCLVEISVRTQADQVGIQVSVNGTPLTGWMGRAGSVTTGPSWRLLDPGRLGLGGNNVAVAFHAAKLRMVSGEAAWVRADSARP